VPDDVRQPLPLPTLRVVGASGSGKTTLIAALIRELSARGYRVAALKHAAAHEAPPDCEGKDTQRFAAAGAAAVVGAFRDEVVVRLPASPDLPTLAALVAPVADLLLVEGFHDEPIDAILVEGEGAAAREVGAGRVIAVVATSERSPPATASGAPPRYGAGDIAALAAAIEHRCGLSSARS